jgi:hypothetical protein
VIQLSTFTLIRTLEELKQKGKQKQNEFVCKICGKTYKTANGLKNHMETKHNKDGE